MLALNPGDLAFRDINNKKWTVEPGSFELVAGSSSEDTRLTKLSEIEHCWS